MIGFQNYQMEGQKHVRDEIMLNHFGITKHVVWGMLVVISFSSCSTKEGNVMVSYQLDEFGPLIRLKEPDTLHLNTSLFRVKGMTLYKDYIIVSDDYDTIVRAFKYPDIEYIDGNITKGHGPDEILGPRRSGFYSTNNGITIHGLDGKVFLIDIEQEKINIKKKMRLPGIFFDVNYLFDLGDSVYYVTDYTNHHAGEFVSYSFENNDIGSFSEYPFFMSDFTFDIKARYSLGLITVKKDFSRFAKTYLQLPVLRIYEKDGSEAALLSIKNPDGIKTIIQTYPEEGEITVYGGKLYSTDKYIFAEYKIARSNNYIVDTQILVYDWNGNPVCRYYIGDYCEKSILPFCVSEDNRFLFIVSDSLLNEMYRYKLDGLLKDY